MDEGDSCQRAALRPQVVAGVLRGARAPGARVLQPRDPRPAAGQEMVAAMRPVDAIAAERPDWTAACTATPRRHSPAVEAGARVAGVKPGMRERGVRSSPEEHPVGRPHVHAPALPRTSTRRASSSRDVEGRIEVVKDPSGSRRSPASARRYLRPGLKKRTDVVATVHREANVAGPRLGRIADGLDRLDDPSHSAHPPRSRSTTSSSRPTSHLLQPLGYLDLAALRLKRARPSPTPAGCRRPRRPRPRHAAVHRVGGHGFD